jgi:hypothetical protein
LPAATAKFSAVVRSNKFDTVQKVQAAAKEIERATNQATGAPAKLP